MNINDLQALQNQTTPDVELAQAKFRASQLEKEVARLNKALEQALRYEEWVYSDEKRCPELAAWLKENRS
jgi:hypothetical protein